MIVDDFTDYYWILFIQQKKYLKEKFAGLILDLKNQKIIVTYFRCDDEGEKKALEDLFRDIGMGINVKKDHLHSMRCE